MHYTYWIVVVFVCVCGHMLDTYKGFSPPYSSSFKLVFAMKTLLGIPWNVKSTLRSLYHKLTLIQELVINQLPRWDYYLQGKYGLVNTHRFIRQFKIFISYTRMVGPNGLPARPWLMLILKKRKNRARVDPKKNRARVLLVACVVRTLANHNQSSIRVLSQNIWQPEF